MSYKVVLYRGGEVDSVGGIAAGAGAVFPSTETVKFVTPGNKTPPIIIPEPDAGDDERKPTEPTEILPVNGISIRQIPVGRQFATVG